MIYDNNDNMYRIVLNVYITQHDSSQSIVLIIIVIVVIKKVKSRVKVKVKKVKSRVSLCLTVERSTVKHNDKLCTRTQPDPNKGGKFTCPNNLPSQGDIESDEEEYVSPKKQRIEDI